MRHEAHLALWTLCLAALAAAGLMSFHLYFKPTNLEWSLYDPSFLSAINGNLDNLFVDKCDGKNVIMMGSSIPTRALSSTRPVKSRWDHQVFNINETLTITMLKRAGASDLRLFLPFLDKLPVCPTTIVLHADMFIPYDVYLHKYIHKKKTNFRHYFMSPMIYLRDRLEYFWPVKLQNEYMKREIITNTCHSKKCLKRYVAKRKKRIENFVGIHPEHRVILNSLRDRGKQVIILHIGRSKSLEKENHPQELALRTALQDLASESMNITYASFGSLDDNFYADYKHLNSYGIQEFRTWFESELSRHRQR